MESNLAPLLATLGSFAMFSWIAWVVVEGRRRRERLKLMTEFHNRLLDKIGSAREFGEFLQTEGGNRFLDSLSIERSRPTERILRSIQTGVVLSLLGLTLLLLRWWTGGEAFTVIGALGLAIGVSFLVSSLVSYRLSKTWGLIQGGESGRSERPAA
jgi:hypothetical protein